MALREKVLQKKAAKLELKVLQKSEANQERLSELTKLLDNAYQTRRPKPNDYHYRRELIKVFNDIAKELYGNCSDCPVVEEFGSFTMDLFTAGSDLDLSINFSNNADAFPRERKIKTLRKFAKKFYALQSKGHVSGVNPILAAKVPILKVIDCGTGVECDLSVENRDGILKSQTVRLISSIDERFQKLSCLMKAWAKAHDINSSKDRTLNSLSIILLVAFHLQTRDPPILPPFSVILEDGTDLATVGKTVNNFLNYGTKNTESVAELFVSLLYKLASIEKLWSKGLCASTYRACWTSKMWETKIGSMSVEDFTDRSQNVARAVGKAEVEDIYKCIQLSILHVKAFMDGQIQGPKLKESLFGHMDNIVNGTIGQKVGSSILLEPIWALPERLPTEGSIGTQRPVDSNPISTGTKRKRKGVGKVMQLTESWRRNISGTLEGHKMHGWGGEPTRNWGTLATHGWGGGSTTGIWGGSARQGWVPWEGTSLVSWAGNPAGIWGGPARQGWGGNPTGSWGGNQEGWRRWHHQAPPNGDVQNSCFTTTAPYGNAVPSASWNLHPPRRVNQVSNGLPVQPMNLHPTRRVNQVSNGLPVQPIHFPPHMPRDYEHRHQH